MQCGAVHLVSVTAPPHNSKAIVAAKQLSTILARDYGQLFQRLVSWQCVEHGLEGSIVMTFADTEAVKQTCLWVMKHRQEYMYVPTQLRAVQLGLQTRHANTVAAVL